MTSSATPRCASRQTQRAMPPVWRRCSIPQQNQLQHLLLLLLLALTLLATAQCIDLSEGLTRASCTDDVMTWAQSRLAEAEEAKEEVRLKLERKERKMPELIFFLHIPRAGGKSYNQCFLSNLLPWDMQCNMSYHKARDALTKPCQILATHDDYSILKTLPPGPRTFVTSSFRDPVSRVLSSYEFASETAARCLSMDAKAMGADETVMGARRRVNDYYSTKSTLDTRNVWPWSVISQAVEEDLWARRDFVGIPPDPPGFDPNKTDMYSRPHLGMPLEEFIQMPLAHDIIHNNAVFQMAGITNNSILPEATRLRHCVVKYPELGEHILTLAKARVDTLSHVAFTDRLEEGMALLGAMIGRSFYSKPMVPQEPGWKPKCSDMPALTNMKDPAPTLLKSYFACMREHKQKSDLTRKTAYSLWGDINFTRKERSRIREDLIGKIMRLNYLDAKLVLYAKEVYLQRLMAFGEYMENFGKPNLEKDCVR